MLVGSQRFSDKISSISYDGFVNHKKYNNYLFKALSSLFPSITCFYCNKKGYMIHWGSVITDTGKVKKIWVSKGTVHITANL